MREHLAAIPALTGAPQTLNHADSSCRMPEIQWTGIMQDFVRQLTEVVIRLVVGLFFGWFSSPA